MTITYTPEQQLIFDEIIQPTNPIVTIRATAGSAKSSSLVAAVNRYKQVFPDATVRYIVFGAMAAEEAKREFGKYAIVSTLHAYAYSQVVKQYALGTVKSFLTWRDLPKSISRPFGTDADILMIIEDYCTSAHLTIDSYVAEQVANPEVNFNRKLVPPIKQILNQMAQGHLPITHSFYLKLFHILVMTNSIQLASVDRLLVDEFQDMSGLALDIINAIPADQKIFVGDDNQSIFEFLKLQNGFLKYPDAKVLRLSKSFRVDKKYAPAIQQFLRDNLEPDAVFEGMDYPDNPKLVTYAYLTRTNNKLIAKMIELNRAGTEYHLSSKTKVKQIFKLPLALIYAKPAFDQKDPELKHLQHDIDDWGSKVKQKDINLFSYLKETYPNDAKLISAINLVLTFGSEDIIKAYTLADEHRSKPCDLQLMTVHTSKGTTRDVVELDNDVNEAINEVLSIPPELRTSSDRAELCLGFVAISRMRHQLINCKFLDLNNTTNLEKL